MPNRSNKHSSVTYAQNREDIILRVLLGDPAIGFYVDIGANDPTVDSVTKYFYDRGWHGVNIEPNPRLIEKLKQARKRDINLQLAISLSAGEADFREYIDKLHGWSTLSEEMKKSYIPQRIPYKDYKVTTDTTANILDKYVGKQSIDFMKIDVEGFEYEVISSNDWSKFRPKILVIEANHIVRDWTRLLKAANYREVFFDGLNRYYASEEYFPKIDFNIYPRIALENKPESWLEIKEKRALKIALKKLDKKASDLDKKASEQATLLEYIHQHPLRFGLAKIYHYHVKRDQKKKDL